METFEIGKPLPQWHLKTIFGDGVPKIEDFRGKPLLILFFNLACPGCKGRAIPFANRIVYESGRQIHVMGIHTRFEGPEISQEDLKEAKEEFFIRFPYFADTGLAMTFYDYRAGGTPHWILTDENGVVIDSIFGSDPNRALLRLDLRIQEMLDK